MRNLLAILLILFCVAACKREPTPQNPGGVSLSHLAMTLDNKAQTAELKIVARANWTLAVSFDGSDSDWMVADITNGSSGTTRTVRLAVEENSSGQSRIARVKVTPASGKAQTLVLTQNAEDALSGVNEWMYNTLSAWYYWNDAVKAATPPVGSTPYLDFLPRLLMGLQGARDNTENPPTMDGGVRNDGSRYIYSYVERLGGTTRAPWDEGMKTTFGFDGIPVTITGAGRFEILVTWVLPGGPAEGKGVKRGMWISKFDGVEIRDYMAFFNRLDRFEGGTSMTITDRGDTPYHITAAPTRNSPIIFSDVITTDGGKKTAYLVYNQFQTGEIESGGTDGEFDRDLREKFKEFKAEGASELVLDLRYNLGGYLSSCQILTSLAGRVDRSMVFEKYLYNDDIARAQRFSNPQVDMFLNEPNSLGLDKIYVLATGSSASASESVINSLRGVGVEVVHIGEQTEGKNVGMNLFTTVIDGYTYELWPITFKSMNAEDFCDFAGGFTPDYNIDEFWDVLRGRTLYEFGDKRERLLGAALTLIDGGQVTPDSPQTRTSTAAVIAPRPRDPMSGGARRIRPTADTNGRAETTTTR